MKPTVLIAALMGGALLTQPALAQRQILTAVNVDHNGDNVSVDLSSSTADQYVGHVYNGSDAHAQTNYGVNKVYGSATNGGEISSTSAWLDTFTVQGNAGDMVDMTFTFTVDGSIAHSSSPYFNFQVFALRGNGWSINGTGNSQFNDWYSPREAGDDYDDLYFQRTTANAIIQLSARNDEQGMLNYANAAGTAGAFQSNVVFDAATNAFTQRTVNQLGQTVSRIFYPNRVETFVDGVPQPGGTVFYNAGSPAAAQFANARLNMENNYSLLDSAELCPADFCAQGLYEPTPVTVSFRALVGSSFTLGGIMLIDSLENGTIDFFNTARLTGVAKSELYRKALARSK